MLVGNSRYYTARARVEGSFKKFCELVHATWFYLPHPQLFHDSDFVVFKQVGSINITEFKYGYVSHREDALVLYRHPCCRHGDGLELRK